MERGVIEGAEWINCEEDKKLGLHQVAKHYYTPGMHEPVTGGQLMINGDVWKKLTPDLQEIIKVASVYATTTAQLRLQPRNRGCLPGTAQDGRPDASHAGRDPERTSSTSGRRSRRSTPQKNPFYRKVIDSQKAYAEQIVPFKLSWFPPYNFAGKYYWKSKIYLTKK